MTYDEMVLAFAERFDYFTTNQLQWLHPRMAQATCSLLARSGKLILIEPAKGPHAAIFASPARLIRKCELEKLEVECTVARRTLAGNYSHEQPSV